MRASVWLSVLILCSPHASPASAQTAVHAPAAEILLRGTVLDAMRGPIGGAQVLVTSTTSTISVSTTTDPLGAFTLRVPSGEYMVHVQADGFRNAERRVDVVRPGAAASEFVLQVEGVREEVTVTAPGGYHVGAISSATRTSTPLLDVPQ